MVSYHKRWNYHIGRVILGLIIMLIAAQMADDGSKFYVQFLHAYRRMLMPGVKNRINENLTYEDVNVMVVQAVAALLALSGFLIMLNRQILGPFCLFLAMAFILATQDNPMLYDHIKPTLKNKHYRFNELFRHLALVGSGILIFMDKGAEDKTKNKDEVKEHED